MRCPDWACVSPGSTLPAQSLASGLDCTRPVARHLLPPPPTSTPTTSALEHSQPASLESYSGGRLQAGGPSSATHEPPAAPSCPPAASHRCLGVGHLLPASSQRRGTIPAQHARHNAGGQRAATALRLPAGREGDGDAARLLLLLLCAGGPCLLARPHLQQGAGAWAHRAVERCAAGRWR